MANVKQEKVTANTPVSVPKPADEGSRKEKKSGLLFGLFAFLVSLIIIAGILGGAFYLVIHNNVNGLGERYRNSIQRIPIVKLALPKVADPEDPKYLTDNEIKAKYQQLRKDKDELTKQLDEANKKIAELQKAKADIDKLKAENDQIKSDMQSQKNQFDQQKKQLADDKKKLDQLAAGSDKTGFKEFFEKMEPETAKQMYNQILQEQKASDDEKKFAQLYETMDPSAAAAIFEQMGNSKIDLVVNILKNMKKEASAQILAQMTPAYASNVTEKLSKIYIKGN